MLNQPSARRKSSKKPVELNLVPIIDTMVALIAFLLYTMSFLALASIESPFPQASSREVQEKLKEKPLQLTVSIREKDTEVWSPFEKFKAKIIPHTSPGQPDLKGIHDALIDVKQKFPMETKVVIVPTGDTNYDNLISVMDVSRNLDPTDPAIFVKNAQTGNDEAVKVLFPEVIFGNLLEVGG